MPSTSDQKRVTLEMPAATDFLQLLRLNAALIGGEVLDLDEAEDLKIGVEELAAAVLAVDGDPTVAVTFTAEGSTVRVDGTRRVDGEVALGEFAPIVLDAMVDTHSLTVEDGEARFSLEKTARGG